MIPLGNILGQDAAVNALNADITLGRVAHAYLLVGGEGLGKRTCADAFARAFNGSEPVKVIEPKANGAIGVDVVRELIEQFGTRPRANGRHVAIIDHAEGMTTQAQNALLKVIEDPPGDAVFIMCSISAEKLLKTVVSRARVARFLPINMGDFCAILKSHGVANPESLYALSGLSPGVALKYSAMPGFEAIKAACSAAVDGGYGAHDLPRLVKPLMDADHLTVLNIIESLTRTRMADNLNAVRLAQSLIQARKEDAAHVAWRNVLERLFYRESRGFIPLVESTRGNASRKGVTWL